ncbi:MAG: MASE1 domain-containing protein [Gemmatimonadaceae bacterium]|nr:MASE1 domain-containing protein [Gemmatimonadaceae bacterium]
MRLTGKSPTHPFGASTLVEIALLAIAYGIAAKVGLMLDAVSGFASLVWPASGIAIAALYIRGAILWPGVWLGAMVANYISGAPPLAAAGIASGNTLEAVVALYALRFFDFDPAIKRVRDAIALIVVAAMGSTIVAASIGVFTLYLAGMVPSVGIVPTWRAWWIGDMIGDLTVAPMILVWSRTLAHSGQKKRFFESVLLALTAALTVSLVFSPQFQTTIEGFSGLYLVFPVLIWAAVRFGPRGAVSTGFIISAIAMIATIGGNGPFINDELSQSLLALQMFVGVQAATFLVLGASMGERRESERVASEARTSAEDANRAKSEFLAVMSHELRTPLNAISGYVQLLEMDLHGPLTAKQRESLERIGHNQRHLLTLINDILGFARIETGKLNLKLEAVLVRDILDDMEPLVLPDVTRKQISFSVNVTDDCRNVFADRERLRQVILNVVSNAIKFTPENGTVTVNAACDGAGFVTFKVTDTGVGIPAEQQGNVFEPFVQAEYGKARSFSGVGLGLSIVRNLVQAMNGSVWLESEFGVGTTVMVKLPEGPRT